MHLSPPHIHTTCSTSLILVDFIKWIKSGAEKNMTLLIMQFCHLILCETSLSLASFDQLVFLSVPRHDKPLSSQSGCSMSCLGQAFSVVLLVFKDYKGCMLTTSRWSVFIICTQFLSIFLCNYVTVCLNYNVVTIVHYLFTQWHAPPRTARLHNPGKTDKPFRHFTKSRHPLCTITLYSQCKWMGLCTR